VSFNGDVITIDVQSEELPAKPGGAERAWAAVERLLIRLGDRLNPILVKETRQALKSRQFLLTFTLLLLCGWFWSIGGVALIGPDIYYRAMGTTMFYGYYLILSFPLLVIVPFGAFRSLAAEQEERTYELLSITTLGPRQIVAGKLGSAALQMIVYLSAITPCLAFTYMLRGIDLPTILIVLCYLVLGSMGLAMLGLLFGTLAAEKHLQVILAVLVIVGLFLTFWVGCLIAYGILEGSLRLDRVEFWQINTALLTGYLSYFALVFYAAAARLTFASDNRSTRLRAIMFLQQALCVGWMGWIWIQEHGDWGVAMVLLLLAGIHWYAMGAMMIGESPELSQRVKRRLPQSFLGRVFLTWFNPGPGTGYMFAVSSMMGALIIVLMALGCRQFIPAEWAMNRRTGIDWISCAFVMGTIELAYITVFLGLGLLLVRLGRKLSRVGILTSVLIQVMLLLLACGVPLVIQLTSPTMRRTGYSLLQITNPFWTLAYVAGRTTLPAQASIVLLLVSLAAIVVFLLNLPGIIRELRQVRIAKPERVAEEDAALAPPTAPTRTSPWDE
jgi:hypothetical protein